MPAAPRRAGSALLTHTQSRLRALQRWLRSVPAEPDHAFSHSDIVPHFVQTDPTGHNHDAPDDPEVRMDHMSIAAGRSSLFPTTNVPPHVSVSGKWHNLSATQLGTSGACAMQERPGTPSPDHRHCVESLGRSGVGVPAIEHDHPISLVKDASEMATLQARRSSVASRRDKKMVLTHQLYQTVTPASPGSHGTAAKAPRKILVYPSTLRRGRG